MDKREAVLRELNLYPLWVRRDQPASVVLDAPVHVLAADEMRVPLAADVSTTPTPNPNPSQPPLAPARGTPVGSPLLRSDPSAVRGGAGEQVVFPPDKGGARGVGGLDWPELKQLVHDCTACRLRAGCTQTVFGVGDENADWLFIGEGPGADEDALGEPFVGQAGKLLDNMLLAIKLKRGNNVYIANIVKCRPPGNRTPAADEIATCLPYLQRQIELIKPKLIVALGKVASNALLGRDATLASLRGKLHDYRGIPVIVTYHPAYLLRSPTEKAKTWQDLCLAVQKMQEFTSPT
ncbi:MAG: uracil-DNA glycosylase [Pseudomonadota bacterium]